MSPTPKSFVWYELMTSDADAAEAFYSKVVGWRAQPYANSPVRYTVMNAGDRGVGGIMPMPDEYRKMGGHPAWVGYIYSDDVDATVESVKRAGGAVHRPPADIPEIGRFAVVADPQGATFMLHQADWAPTSRRSRRARSAMSAGTSSTRRTGRRHSTSTPVSSTGPRATQWTWGAMGTYQLFAAGDAPIGGMMNKPPSIPVPAWGFYFNVAGIDAAIG